MPTKPSTALVATRMTTGVVLAVLAGVWGYQTFVPGIPVFEQNGMDVGVLLLLLLVFDLVLLVAAIRQPPFHRWVFCLAYATLILAGYVAGSVLALVLSI